MCVKYYLNLSIVYTVSRLPSQQKVSTTSGLISEVDYGRLYSEESEYAVYQCVRSKSVLKKSRDVLTKYRSKPNPARSNSASTAYVRARLAEKVVLLRNLSLPI